MKGTTDRHPDIQPSSHQEDDNEEKIESTATNTGQYKNNRSSVVDIVWESHLNELNDNWLYCA